VEIFVDARNKACPQPVLMTKKALDSLTQGSVITMVDNDVARDNVEKLVKSQQLNYTIEKEAGFYKIIINKNGDQESRVDLIESSTIFEPSKANYNLLISRDVFGEGISKLGKLLLKNYLYTLLEATNLPNCILFVNSGVYLTSEGSDCVNTLKELESRGVELLSCGTCLDFYGLKDKLLVGKVTNMYEIVERTTTSRTVNL